MSYVVPNKWPAGWPSTYIETRQRVYTESDDPWNYGHVLAAHNLVMTHKNVGVARFTNPVSTNTLSEGGKYRRHKNTLCLELSVNSWASLFRTRPSMKGLVLTRLKLGDSVTTQITANVFCTCPQAMSNKWEWPARGDRLTMSTCILRADNWTTRPTLNLRHRKKRAPPHLTPKNQGPNLHCFPPVWLNKFPTWS